MSERPKSITVICWFIIVTRAISLITGTLTMNNPMTREIMSKSLLPISIQYVFMYAGLIIALACGIAMLKRQNWGRLLYVGWSIVAFIIALVTSPMKIMMIPAFIVFFIIVFFLFRPSANAYFKAPEVI